MIAGGVHSEEATRAAKGAAPGGGHPPAAGAARVVLPLSTHPASPLLQLKVARKERLLAEEALALTELRRAVQTLQHVDQAHQEQEQAVSRWVTAAHFTSLCRLRTSPPS